MPYIEIKKGTKVRKIFAPSKKWKSYLRGKLPALHVMQELMCDKSVVYGFYRGRSPVTNAQQHVGYDVSVCLDLKDFFPSVTFRKVRDAWRAFVNDPEAKVPPILAGRYWVKKSTGLPAKLPEEYDKISDEVADNFVAEQGLPTSPILANIAFSKVDRAILNVLEDLSLDCRYTRYADDLTISLSSYFESSMINPLSAAIVGVVEHYGFTVNPAKTHILLAKNGRRVITGVAVDHAGIYPTRKVRRKLRAAKHNGWVRKARGLAEFCQMKQPTKAAFDDKIYRMTVKLLRWKVPTAVVQGRLNQMRTELLEIGDLVRAKQEVSGFADFASHTEIIASIEKSLALCNIVSD